MFRRVNRLGKVWGEGITPKAIWHIVKAAACQAGIQNLAPQISAARVRDSASGGRRIEADSVSAWSCID